MYPEYHAAGIQPGCCTLARTGFNRIYDLGLAHWQDGPPTAPASAGTATCRV